MKSISILGSTGSIGTSALEVIRHLGPEYQVTALAACSNIDLLQEQIKEFRPKLVAVFDEDKAVELKMRLPNQQIISGLEGILAAAAQPEANVVLSAISGTIGMAPTFEAVKAGKVLALANKEALVSGGSLLIDLAKKKNVPILPVDSEHSALFQCLQGNSIQSVNRLILTASGGPFRSFNLEELRAVTPEKALKHPNWSMGRKITIDSSTLMNKGLEVIEAHWLFDVPLDKIEVVVHPQSIIHSLVEYVDGSMLAQMSEPTMIVPIQYALTYPERKLGLLKPFDFIRHGKLEFSCPDLVKFRALKLAYDAIREGQSLPCYMNAANEVLVYRFLNHEIGWLEIAEKLETLMQKHEKTPVASLEEIVVIDNQARREAETI
ncbi:MAG: 1-deoxy-D-xylulose-5-phosphate reductoisomerase [Parachlamydiaceae bacterium]